MNLKSVCRYHRICCILFSKGGRYNLDSGLYDDTPHIRTTKIINTSVKPALQRTNTLYNNILVLYQVENYTWDEVGI